MLVKNFQGHTIFSLSQEQKSYFFSFSSPGGVINNQQVFKCSLLLFFKTFLLFFFHAHSFSRLFFPSFKLMFIIEFYKIPIQNFFSSYFLLHIIKNVLSYYKIFNSIFFFYYQSFTTLVFPPSTFFHAKLFLLPRHSLLS